MTHKSALECIATMDTADMPDKSAVIRLFKAIARAALMEEGHAETVFGDDWSDAHKRAAGKAFTQAYHDTHGPLADLLKLK